MKYLELLRLDLVHPYYADQRCPDLEIEATPGTEKLLRDCRAVLKQSVGGIRILVPVTDGNIPFIALPANPVFAFHLRLNNPDFALFTELGALNAAEAPLYSNATPARSGTLELGSRQASATEQLTVNNPGKKESFALGGQPSAGLSATAFSVQGLGSGKTVRVSYDEGARVVTLNTAGVDPGTPFTITYPIAARLETGVFADVEINYDSSETDLSGGNAGFEIVFAAKQARWKYYVVTDSKMTSAVLNDQDQAVVFDAKGQTDLTQSPDPTDEVARVLAERYPNMQYFRFLSNALIPCQKAARKGLQLQLNGNKALDSIANPALQNYSIDTRNSKQEYTLYQIVKYFTL